MKGSLSNDFDLDYVGQNLTDTNYKPRDLLI